MTCMHLKEIESSSFETDILGGGWKTVVHERGTKKKGMSKLI